MTNHVFAVSLFPRVGKSIALRNAVEISTFCEKKENEKRTTVIDWFVLNVGKL